jgi:hypothetical protein
MHAQAAGGAFSSDQHDARPHRCAHTGTGMNDSCRVVVVRLCEPPSAEWHRLKPLVTKASWSRRLKLLLTLESLNSSRVSIDLCCLTIARWCSRVGSHEISNKTERHITNILPLAIHVHISVRHPHKVAFWLQVASCLSTPALEADWYMKRRGFMKSSIYGAFEHRCHATVLRQDCCLRSITLQARMNSEICMMTKMRGGQLQYSK